MTKRKPDGIRVLVAEDDYLVSQMIQGVLEEIGCVVAGVAVSGIEAVDMTVAQRPDVVLMDIRMPDMDGIEAARQIHERCPTPIVVLTAYETRDLVEQMGQAGAGAYLIKPPNARELERAITIARARFQDIVHLRRLNQDLLARNEELDAFAHTVAHDLQNPLALVIGFAEVLSRHGPTLSETETADCIREIERAGRKMSHIIDELLLFSRARDLEVELVPLDMGAVVAAVEERLAQVIAQNEAEIRRPERWPLVWGHSLWIEEVWANYVSNAIKYGGAPPLVELGAEEQPDGRVRFWVRDNGDGLSVQDQARLFTPFTRLHQGRSRGHGLGLSIVRRIVTRLGGEVGVKSVLGKGSEFSFTLSRVE